MINPTGGALNVQFVGEPSAPITRDTYIMPMYAVNPSADRVNIATFTKTSSTYLFTDFPTTISAVLTRRQIAPNAELVTFNLNMQEMMLNPFSVGHVEYSLNIDTPGEKQLGKLWLGNGNTDYGVVMALVDVAVIGGIKFSGYYKFHDNGKLEIHTGNNGVEFTTLPIDGLLPIPMLQGNGKMLFSQVSTMFSK